MPKGLCENIGSTAPAIRGLLTLVNLASAIR